jgi:predicted CXXCH cytochrome family protein
MRRWTARWRGAAAGLAVLACGAPEDRPADDPASPAQARYLDDGVCAGCHADAAAAWSGSHHDLAMQEATSRTVLGDFDDAVFEHHGVVYRFLRRGDAFAVRTAGADGVEADFRVAYVFGVDPLQQVLLDSGAGRLQALTIAWDTERRRWFALYDEPTPPGDLLHWTGDLLNWNAMCADCHSTGVVRGYDPEADAYATRWSALDVGCQACHGPGSKHVEWAAAADAASDAAAGLVVTFGADAPEREIEACAPCHSRRHPISEGHRAGEPFLDHYLPALLDEGLYFADGQIQDEVYVYGSFAQSPMYRAGVRCTDCHEPHSARLVAEGNALCAQCHRPDPPARFPSLAAAVYDAQAHHHHEPGAAGSACVDCHMPARTYMVVDPRRDHSFRVPRPDLAARLGTPDACSGCHTDRSPEWAAGVVADWFPHGRGGAPHFAEALAAGRAGASDAGPQLRALAADPTQAPIVRASALSLLRRHPSPSALDALVAALDDGEPLLRATAASGLAGFAGPGLPRGLQRQISRPLLSRLRDPRRAVRIESARALSGLERDVLDPDERAALDVALAEFTAVYEARADDPGSHLGLAVLYANLGRRGEAEAAYRTALRLQPAFLPARFNLATLYNQEGRNAEAERELREILAVAPDHGEGHYSLGLLLAEMQRLEEAEVHLGRAAEALPDRARVRYNHGLALLELGRPDAARRALEQAAAVDPGDPDIARALAASRGGGG